MSESVTPGAPAESIQLYGEVSDIRTRDSLCASAAKLLLFKALREYTVAGDYFRSIGAQSNNTEYGGSRSMIYLQMIKRARTLRELQATREAYAVLHTDPSQNHDESGAILRIVGFKLRHVPIVNGWLETKVRNDDKAMAQAKFEYPDDCVRVTGEKGYETINPSPNKQSESNT